MIWITVGWVQGSRSSTVIVRSRRRRRGRRMDLGERVEMSKEAEDAGGKQEEREFEETLLRGHAVSTDMGSLDWKRMKIPPVLSSAQSARLFKTMQPMKVDASMFACSCCAIQHVLAWFDGLLLPMPGHLSSARELAAGRAAERSDGGRAGGGQQHERAAAAPPPRRRTSRQEQAHQGTTAPFTQKF
jgi:hypothetical protein